VTIGGAVRADLQRYLEDSGATVGVDEVFAQIWNPSVRAWLGEYFRPTPQTLVAFNRAWDETIVGLRERVRAYFASQDVAAMVFPTTPITAGIEVPGTGDLIIDGVRVNLGVWRNVQNNTPASVWDGPGISLPAGLTADGLPVGLELDGPLGGDRRLLGVAMAVETLLPRLPPPEAARALFRKGSVDQG
jgi:mandelamide amidase